MQNYGYFPYYQPYPNHFVNALNQNYGNQPQQQITTQPLIMQPQSKIIPVSNKDEANATPVDLINGTPTFFYNKSKNEIYLKQFDIKNGNSLLKTYQEILEPSECDLRPVKSDLSINTYKKDFEYIKQGIDGLYRILNDRQSDIKIDEVNADVIDIEPEPMESYTKTKNNKKRGQ